MRLKRVIAAILCIIMTMSLLVGCVEQNSTQTKSESEVTKAETVVNDAKNDGEDNYVNNVSDDSINLDADFVSGVEGVAPEEMPKEDEKDIITAFIDANNKKEETVGTATQEVSDENEGVPFDLAYPDVFNSSDVEYADNAILVKLKDTYSDKTAEGLKAVGIGKMEVLFELEGYKWYTAYLLKGTDVNTAMEAVREVSGVVLAEYNYKYETAVSGADAAEAEICNNPKYHDQWPREKFGIKKAWGHMHDKHKTGGGSSSVTVAVIDTGVDYAHVDLKANMWKNTGEIADNGIDDDGNGYVDDYYGIDMTAKKGSGMDDNGHGTHVAGIIGASNNKEGMVGYAYNTKIMSVKAGDASGYFLQNNIAEAIIYAYDQGADVINMSFGGSACSIAVQDALAVAYTRCVLVASAGNDGEPNEITDYDKTPTPNYPAALSYVIGVMSVDEDMTESSFTNWDVDLYNSVEYEVYAPGSQIISTLPGNRYGKLSGTSMAAPVVAAQAALLRSYYSDTDKYPTKFIYGQIVGTAEDIVKCNNPEKHTVMGQLHNIPGVVNFYNSITELPSPDVGMSDYTIFDTETFVADTAGVTKGYLDLNNGDGIVDAGETIALGMTLKNRWGMSENTIVHIDAVSEGGVANPYVTFLNNDVNYESVGTYSENDSGKLYSEDGELWIGWEKPFYIYIDKDCPNDYTVTLNVTIICENALDEEDNKTYVTEEQILLKVRKGVILPNKISEDMTLTKDNYYIIPNSTIVMEGATLIIEEGTKVQFWCSSQEDAYADEGIVYIKVAGNLISKGTEEEPVEMFPSELMEQYRVEIYTSGDGYASLEYTNVVNPYLTIDEAKNCEFTQNYKEQYRYRTLNSGQVTESSTNGMVKIPRVEGCVFYKVGGGSSYSAFVLGANYSSSGSRIGTYNNCVFVDSNIYFSISSANGCVFYGNNNYEESETKGYTSLLTASGASNSLEIIKIIKNTDTGTTYIALNGVVNQNAAERFAKTLGGHLAVFESEDELEYVVENIEIVANRYYNVGLYRENETIYNNDGTVLEWDNSQFSVNDYCLWYGNVYLDVNSSSGNPIIEIPGDINITDIELEEYVVDIDTDMTYQIKAMVSPTLADTTTLVYESQDEAIVTVDENGLVTPIAQGSTMVRVYSPDYAVYNYVTVNVLEPVDLENIAICEGNITMNIHSKRTLHIEYNPTYTTKKEVVYSSSDEDVVVVNEKGVITAVAEGAAVITATGHQGMAAMIQVDVIIPVESIAFVEKLYTTSLSKDDGTEFYPIITPTNATIQDLTWESSNPEVCYVDEDGKLIKLQNGSATLRATVAGAEGYDELQVGVTEEDGIDIVMMQEYGDYRAALDSAGSIWIWGKEFTTARKLPFTDVKDFDFKTGSSNDLFFYFIDKEGKPYVYRYDISTQKCELDSATSTLTISNVKEMEVYLGNLRFLLNDGSVWIAELAYPGYSVTQINIAESIVEIAGKTSILYMLSDKGNVWMYNGSGVSIYDTGIVDIYASASGSVKSDTGTEVNGIVKDRENVFYDDGNWYYIEEGKVFVRGSKNAWGHLGVGYTGNVPEYEQVVGITDAKRVFMFYKNMYIQTESGKLYATGSGSNYKLGNNSVAEVHVPTRVIMGEYGNYDSLMIQGINAETEDDVNVVIQKKLVLDFNEALFAGANYDSITLKNSSDSLMGFTKALHLDKLIIVPKANWVVGETYTLTMPANAVSSAYGNANEAYEFTFQYQGTDEEPENDSITESEDEVVEEIHIAIVDEEKFVARHQFTSDEVLEYWNQFVTDGYNTRFYSNVILNRLSDDDTSKWLRITAASGSTTGKVTDAIGFGGNYWGTTNAELIEKQILDFDDYQNLLDINQGKVFTEAPETTFPFVVDAYLELDGERVDTVGNDLVTFVVEFNRDMDTTIDLQVRFGSAYPYADYEVEGSYTTPRQWRGTLKLSTVIENGYQYWSVGNGKAAGTSMKLYTDWGRFPFKIDTSSAQALIMQAEVTETGIKLTWEQDEFTTLAGYNVYRSTTEDGQYTKINRTVIPADTMEWFDDTVEPGQRYYYNFTVVETDMTESEPSGKVQARAMDTMAPNVYHSPIYHAFTGSNLVISATVTDNVGISSATLYYRTVGTEEWNAKTMTNNNDKYSAVIPAEAITVAGVEYYIDATDGITHTYKGTSDAPYSITIQVAVADSEKGDVDGNGAIELKDALMLLMAINDRLNLTEEQFARADLDGNGELAAKEALRIMQYVNGTVTSVLP